MAEPSNIRINPFTGTGGATNYIELTEKHIIPSVSPYVIRLNEVPEKQDPSNMKMVYVNESTGAATSTTLTEVAATPGKGEFRPDYSTNALDDKTWNTGLIEFSASDAGKIVQVTYTGTGTLAGVNSNHWPSWYTDRGDGSNGDFVPTGNTTINGIKNYKSVFIKSGLTITCSANTWIKCQGAFINKGTINVTPCGGRGGTGIKTTYYGNEGGSSGLYGASGGAGGKIHYDNSDELGGPGGSSLTGIQPPIPMMVVGSGGGSGAGRVKSGNGGKGGGSITITATSFNNTGSIKALGENGKRDTSANYNAGGGGGGGGSILIVAKIIIKGTLTVTGGTGATGYDGGGTGANGANGLVFTKALGVI